MTQSAPEFKVLQSIAFLAVVLQSSLLYTMNQGNVLLEQSLIMGMLFNLAKFSAPAFIFIVGFHLIRQYTKQLVYKEYIYEKATHLLIPYFFWSILYLVTTNDVITLQGGLKSLLLGTAAPHLWYVIMMFQIHLLFPLLCTLFYWFQKRTENKKDIYKYMTIFACLYFFLMWYSSHYIFNGEKLTSSTILHYTDRSFFFYSFYFVMGGIAAVALQTWRIFVMKHIPLITILFFILFLFINYELFSFYGANSIHLTVSTYLKPSMFLYIVCEIMILYVLSIMIVKRRGLLYKTLKFIGNYTYGAYLAHFFFLHIGTKFLSLFALQENTIVYSLLLFSVTAVLSIFTMVICSTLPFHTWVTGPSPMTNMKWAKIAIRKNHEKVFKPYI
ncbi:membrane protein [Bacillus mycoides]|uniref:acyltransferase n=1 Tax=Bacillus cereus group TaxID=86661 RepID=UPI00087304C6|nr:acyltransferase [Bacillus mycoides]OFD38182.1 membrane protein [Bacillus mycoides]OFD53522.1 membrane protein [Bacillus mycoides]OFD55589.1 membrane protein [Bacillus mycoides]OFD59718.1 membrane protein [Bacillus mycoides]OFD90014.1 membrane protein [Bacillus mycoides]